MARIRNLTDQTLSVPALGRAVAPEEIVDVPDDVFLSYAWPRSLWQVTANPKANPTDEHLPVLPDAWPDELAKQPSPEPAPDVPDQPALEGEPAPKTKK